ncbi:MAG: hypothetical protein QOD86_2044 [Miltoncostaeaceae bacterium]|nr:hypothetical protein [Miltoncostaeaceae bacterium]
MTSGEAGPALDRPTRRFAHLLVSALGSLVAGIGVLIDAEPSELVAIGCGLLGLAAALVVHWLQKVGAPLSIRIAVPGLLLLSPSLWQMWETGASGESVQTVGLLLGALAVGGVIGVILLRRKQRS